MGWGGGGGHVPAFSASPHLASSGELGIWLRFRSHWQRSRKVKYLLFHRLAGLEDGGTGWVGAGAGV